MKYIVTHSSPDLDAITSVWLIKRFLQGWEDAVCQFVPAGERSGNGKWQMANGKSPIEKIGDDEIIHVDTGLGPLDHHQTADTNVCAASLTLDFIKRTINNQQSTINKEKLEALKRMVKVVVDIDHFKEVFWKDPTADYHEFSLVGILDGLKVMKPDQDDYYLKFVMQCLDAILHQFENRIWAEQEIKDNGKVFNTRFGKGIGFETINDTVIKLSQKMGYVIAVRKDPRKGYVRVKAMPSQAQNSKLVPPAKPSRRREASLWRSAVATLGKTQDSDIDLTLAYEKLKKMDPEATWFLHVGRKMLLNGSVKNPKMRPTKLSLSDIIKVLEKI
ncbi:MAG: hypothetical protein A2958_02300 [Candidatus Levybacteria bacterium RIFCSPLOWO2_01_FULL_38_13]|nr:MAG: hypothetical protein A2629_03930 [Candidatus Levybacteria bacterium RIFCSPHIGHO2_01_FULL_41_15]OGH35081.1 MAG: hypothetical protein A2958_02300 [Candidatus Levybacteria bacterium RIFCSPLOWO2_01_FULL_38_13]